VALEQARELRGAPRWVWGQIKVLASLVILGGSVVFIFNIIQTLSLVVRPFSIRAFRLVNRFCAGSWWHWCVLWMTYVLGVRIHVTGDDVPERENAVVVVNHQQMPDILILMAFAGSKKRLGELKWFVKDVLKYVPGVGWGMLFLDCLFVKRDWAADRKRIEQTFAKYRSHQIPFWLVSFVEATRITPKKLVRTQELARKRGLYVPEYVLAPRARGFVASIQGLGERVDAVYDVTIAFTGGIPTLRQFMSGTTRDVHMHVRRFPRAVLPETEDQLAAWLTERFVEKDQLLRRFHATGRLV
jgi:1-acyl-sn-glycerol-3-phosphate acyltransferase